MNIKRLIQFIEEFRTSHLETIRTNSDLQFGTDQYRLLLARFLPVRNTTSNEIYEEIVRVGSGIVANDGDPLSPPQIKEPQARGVGLRFTLGHLDIALQMDAKDVKTLNDFLGAREYSIANQFFANWLIQNLRLALEKKTEIQRCQVLTSAGTWVTPMNSDPYRIDYQGIPDNFTVNIPSGTVAVPQGWYKDDYDIFAEDLLPTAMEMSEEGYPPYAIITSRRIKNVLKVNKIIQERGAGSFRFDSEGNFYNSKYPLYASDEGIDSYFRSQGLPGITCYDETYDTQTERNIRFFPENTLCMFGRTNRREIINTPDYKLKRLKQQVLKNTLGYVGQGISLGQSMAGIVTEIKFNEFKPVGIYVEGYCERFPVLQDLKGVRNFTIPVPAAA